MYVRVEDMVMLGSVLFDSSFQKKLKRELAMATKVEGVSSV